MIAAQSGRKVDAPPTENEVRTIQKDADFSESKPTKLPEVYVTRKMRLEMEKRKKEDAEKSKVIENKSKTTQNVGASEDEISVETNLVTIPVSVFDRNGLYIPNLGKDNFKIFEDGKEQEIAYFGTADKPFTVILLLDTSPSTEFKIEEIQDAAIAFTKQLKAQDNVMVIEFDGNVHVLSEITNDRQKIYKAVKKADFGTGTSLYDAVDFSLRKRLSKIQGRKAIVLFTDGVDTTSKKNSYDSTLYLAQESDSMVFPIYYNTYLSNLGFGGGLPNTGNGRSAEEYAMGKKYLDDLAGSTGGRVFRPESTPGGLTTAFEGIAEELRRQYNIGYYPQEGAKNGDRKNIRVRVDRPNLVIRSRDSYIVGGK